MPMPKAGEPAPEFRLPSDNRREVALSDFRGKYVVLYFFVKAHTSG